MKKVKTSKQAVAVSKDIEMQLTWIPSISPDVVAQEIHILEQGSPANKVIPISADCCEKTLNLKAGKVYTITVHSSTAAGKVSVSSPLTYKGFPMPATDLGITVPDKPTVFVGLPSFPEEAVHAPATAPSVDVESSSVNVPDVASGLSQIKAMLGN